MRWFVDGELVYTQDESYVNDLIHPMRIVMNLWGVDAPGWAGSWNPGVIPAESHYDYVRYYAYTPGAGDSGTNDNFTFVWTDEFHTLSTARWEVAEFGGFGGNLCTFVSNNVATSEGLLRLAMTDPLPNTTSTVRFRVDASTLELSPGDVIYLNGTFNSWCGNCNPMSDADGDGVWELSKVLEAGKHEFLFTKNTWEEMGGAPLGSSCDFAPCDMYGNYGIAVPHGSGDIDTPVYCWGSCDSCAPAVVNACSVLVSQNFDVASKHQCDVTTLIDPIIVTTHR